MSEDDLGQATTDLEPETTETAPEVSEPNSQTSVDAPDSFFDPKDIEGKPELEAAYKQMQSAFTKKMQQVSTDYKTHAEKVAAYDQFMQNPQGTLQALMQQYGLGNQTQQQQAASESFEPNSWDDVVSHVMNQVQDRMKGELAPVYQEVQQFKQKNIEQFMDNNYPDWRVYEDDMRNNLQQHPSLSSDPGLLYRMSVPAEVLQKRATSEALKKLKAQSDASSISGGNTSPRSPKPITKATSFNDAVQMARAQLAQKGT